MSALRSFRRANIFAGIIDRNIIIFLPSDVLFSGRNYSRCSSYALKFSEAPSKGRVFSMRNQVASASLHRWPTGAFKDCLYIFISPSAEKASGPLSAAIRSAQNKWRKRVQGSVRAKCQEQKAKQEIKSVEISWGQKQLRKRRETKWKQERERARARGRQAARCRQKEPVEKPGRKSH